MTIRIVMHNQKGCIDFIDVEDGRIFNITGGVLPWSATDPTLGVFVLKLAAKDSNLDSKMFEVTLGYFKMDISVFLINLEHNFCSEKLSF